MPFRRLVLAASMAAAPIAFAATPTFAQQQSESYKFLDAIRKGDGDVVTKMLGTPGSTVINLKDRTTGDGALHILVRNGNAPFIRYLLAQQGVDPNIRDARNNTPLTLAAKLGKDDLIPLLLAGRANVNLANGAGETALVLAVQNRDVTAARLLLDKGANPDQTDNVAGMSARDYAARDGRSPELAKLLASQPKQAKRAVAGPKL